MNHFGQIYSVETAFPVLNCFRLSAASARSAKKFLRRTVTSVERACVAATHQPEWEPAGGWDNTTAIQTRGSNKVYVYADGTQKQVQANGTVVIKYGGSDYKQYGECSSLAVDGD